MMRVHSQTFVMRRATIGTREGRSVFPDSRLNLAWGARCTQAPRQSGSRKIRFAPGHARC
jgi:hypothetical protein